MSMSTSVQTKQEILDLLSRTIRSLARPDVSTARGSGEQRPDSDVDLIVKFESGRKIFDKFMRVSTFLEDLLLRHVELVTTEALSPYIGPHILREAEYVDLAA